MTWREPFRHKSPLARRLIVWTVLFSSAITLVLTLFQLYRDYRQDVSVIEAHLNQIERVHLPTIAESLWATDQNRLQLQLEGILQLNDMHFVELREGDFVWASAGRLESVNVIRREVPVLYTHDGHRQILGTLTVVATLDGVYTRLFDKAVTILLSNAIKTFLVALFMLLIFHRLVTRHLRRIGDWLARQESDSPPLALDKTTSKPGGDEIDALADTLNEFRDGQAQALVTAATEQQRYASLFDNANDMIYIVEPGSGRILDANRRASEHTGYTRDELLEMTFKQLGPTEAEPEAEAAMRQLSETGSAVFGHTHRHKDGTLIYTEVSSRVIDVEGRKVIESFVRDITERKQSEEERARLFQELELRNREMESFVYTISHDLKSPLITISGFAQLLAKDLERNDKERGRESIEEIRKAAEGMQQLIEDLLLLSRTGQIQGEPEDVDLHALLADVQARCASHIERERAAIRVASPLPCLHVDRVRFGQVLQNLLDNGVKFHRKGVAPVIEIGIERNNGEARLYVRDNGIGIEKRYQEKIFGLFERLNTKREGTGVGLTIARRIVEQHGGRLWVESEPGRGSTFWISLPDSVIVDAGAGESSRDIRTLR